MLKRVIAWMLLLGLLLVLVGCGEGGQEAPAPESSPGASSAAEVAQPQEPEQPVASQPEEIPRTNDELVREIVLTYGAREAVFDGAEVLIPETESLYNYDNSWSGPEEISAFQYYVWFFSTILKEDADQRVGRYKHPLGDGYGWFFPQDIYEERVQKYFDVSISHLRGDGRIYDPELEGYWLGGGGGRGLDPFIDYTYTKSGEYITIDLTMAYPDSKPFSAKLFVRLTGDGGWKYQRMNYYPFVVNPKEGSAWEELEGLTPEQRQLVERAEEFVRVFQVDTSGIPGDSPDGSLPYETRELGGMTYTRYRGSLYQGWEDFRADLLTVLTPEFFRRLNEIGTLQRGIFTEEDGALYFVDMARGTDRTYLPARTRYRIEPGGEDSGAIRITRYSYYCDSMEDPEKDPEPVSYRECPITLVNTADGWRVAELTLPY